MAINALKCSTIVGEISRYKYSEMVKIEHKSPRKPSMLQVSKMVEIDLKLTSGEIFEYQYSETAEIDKLSKYMSFE